MESRHLDVIEMDAASHNGVDDVRQINDAIRYAPVSARYKVYILDEVHMLTPQAFNALLKTLEEPPPHAKFVFATTEIRKVPVTVLSRCQRFDLRRVEAGTLVSHLGQRRRRRRHRDRARGARADRARGGRLGAGFALAARSGHRARRRSGARRARPADARPRRPGAGDRSVRIADGRRRRGGADRIACAVRHRRRSRGGAGRSCRVHAFRHPREDRAGGRRRPGADRGRAHARPRLRREAVDAGAGAHLADAAQGHRRSERGGPPGGGCRDGAGADRLCGRSADARRSGALAVGRQRLGTGAGQPVGAAGRRRLRAPTGLAMPSAMREPTMSASTPDREPRAARRAARRAGSRDPARRRSSRGIGGAAGGRPQLRRAGRARRQEPRHRRQDGARTRRAAGALRGWPARDRARAERAEARWCTTCRASSRNGPTGAGW